MDLLQLAIFIILSSIFFSFLICFIYYFLMKSDQDIDAELNRKRKYGSSYWSNFPDFMIIVVLVFIIIMGVGALFNLIFMLDFACIIGMFIVFFLTVLLLSFFSEKKRKKIRKNKLM